MFNSCLNSNLNVKFINLVQFSVQIPLLVTVSVYITQLHNRLSCQTNALKNKGNLFCIEGVSPNSR